MSVVAVVLAAGASTRMGRPKALLPLADGVTFLGRAVATARRAGVDDVVVVLGPPDGEEIAGRLPPGCRVAWNSEPARGMLSSIQTGIAALHNDAGAVLVWPVDQPLVEVATVRAVIDGEPGEWICAPQHNGRGGHPVRVPRRLFGELQALPADVGLRGLMRAHAAEIVRVTVGDAGAVTDMDTPEEYARNVKA